MSPVRLFVVDDHPVVVEGIERFVATEDGMEVVGAASNVPDALEALLSAAPDVVSFDLRMPGMRGAETIAQLVALGLRVMLFTLEEPSDSVAALVAAGARGYVSKSQGLGTYVRTARSVARGEIVLPAALRGAFGAPDPREHLTPREYQLFRRLAEGETIQEAAHAMGCSASTAYNHFARIKEKLRVTTPAEVVDVGRRWIFDREQG